MRILRSAVNVHAFMIFIVEIFHSFFFEQRVKEREREREKDLASESVIIM